MIQLKNGMHTHAGSLITDTLHPGDVGRSLCVFLDYYDNDRYQGWLEEFPDLYDATADREHPFWNDHHGYSFVNEIAPEAIEALLPEGYYFGAHPGDVADLGIWAVESDE